MVTVIEMFFTCSVLLQDKASESKKRSHLVVACSSSTFANTPKCDVAHCIVRGISSQHRKRFKFALIVQKK